jgi:uncharacterized protein YgiM (DUF1202 family)
MQSYLKNHDGQPDATPDTKEETEAKVEVNDAAESTESAAPVEETETIEEAAKPETTGVVTDCLKLNVREAPSTDAKILAEIQALSEVKVDLGESTDTFYKICNAAGIQGFCMKKYIALCG